MARKINKVSGAGTPEDRWTRREWLSLSGGLVLSSALLDAQAKTAAVPGAGALGLPGRRAIDVHHHFVTPGYLAELEALGNRPNAQLQGWTAQRSIENMDKFGVQTSIVSITQGVDAKDPAQVPRLCRDYNEFGTRMVADHPGRFGLFASLPLPNADASLKELSYAMDVLKADGVALTSHIGEGNYLGDPIFAPVFEEMNRRKVVAFVHPKNTGAAIPASDGSRNIGTGELPYDTTRAIFNVLASGTAERYPDIRFIWAHAGGTALFLLSRFAWSVSENGDFATNYARLKKVMSGFYYDMTLTVSTATIKAIRDVAPASHLLVGSDTPYAGDPRRSMGQVLGQLPYIGLSESEVSGAARRNAADLFPRFKA